MHFVNTFICHNLHHVHYRILVNLIHMPSMHTSFSKSTCSARFDTWCCEFKRVRRGTDIYQNPIYILSSLYSRQNLEKLFEIHLKIWRCSILHDIWDKSFDVLQFARTFYKSKILHLKNLLLWTTCNCRLYLHITGHQLIFPLKDNTLKDIALLDRGQVNML